MSSSNNGGNTVIALKGSFLRTQTRVLSQPLQPEARWRKDRGGNDAGGLSAEAIKDAVSEGIEPLVFFRIQFRIQRSKISLPALCLGPAYVSLQYTTHVKFQGR